MGAFHQKGAFSVFGQTGRDTGVCRCALWAMAFCLLTVFLSGCTAPAADSTVLDVAQTAETPAQQDEPELTEAQAEYVTLFTGDGYTEQQALDIYRYAEELGFTRSAAQKLVAYEAQTEDERLAQAAALFQKQGLSADEADAAAQDFAERAALEYKARLAQGPTRYDGEDDLWSKFILMKDLAMYEDANDALDFLYTLCAKEDPHAETYIAAAGMFLEQIEESGIGHGALVTGFEEEHSMLQVGDIIIAFNNTECRSAGSYTAFLQQLTEQEYTVTVLRPTDGILTVTELTLSRDMPAVILRSLAG